MIVQLSLDIGMDCKLTSDEKSLGLITPKLIRYFVKPLKLSMKFSCGDAALFKPGSLPLEEDLNLLIIILKRKVIGLLLQNHSGKHLKGHSKPFSRGMLFHSKISRCNKIRMITVPTEE